MMALLDPKSWSARSMSIQMLGKKMPVVRSTCDRPEVDDLLASCSKCCVVGRVLLPVIARTPSPVDAIPPVAQIPSPLPPVAQAAAWVGSRP